MRCRRYLAWLLLPALATLGCGPGGPRTVPVSGRVTWEGQPLANAVVTFTPSNPDPSVKPIPESTGRTDAQGNYTLKLDARRPGAVSGSHRVRVSIFDRNGGRGQLVPPQYNKRTTLTFTVPPAGTQEANFTLSGAPTAAGGQPSHGQYR
jgi:hypothetical protein